ncbi:hypothetical protein QJS10_CPA06g02241 [Acorus calamus]|uniref:Uncharacterized protein n=1 Tax=Acorus calamus TaxID=4465 RepID=A0AAV9ENE1_ACOCL|nr:hypothetical protein QJS10_CPA06g02241 [Acorus calamus]
MAETVEEILEFLRRNKFTRAEAALRGELGGRSDLNGHAPKSDEPLKVVVAASVSRELIVKEIECGTANASPAATDLYPWNFGDAEDFTEIVISEQPRRSGNAKSKTSSGLLDSTWSSSRNENELPPLPVVSSSSSAPWKDRKKRTEAVDCKEVILPSVAVENHREELPRLAPVKLKSEDKQPIVHWEEKSEQHLDVEDQSGEMP